MRTSHRVQPGPKKACDLILVRLAGKAQQVLAAGLLQINHERSELSSVHKDFAKIVRGKNGKGHSKALRSEPLSMISAIRDNLEPLECSQHLAQSAQEGLELRKSPAVTQDGAFEYGSLSSGGSVSG